MVARLRDIFLWIYAIEWDCYRAFIHLLLIWEASSAVTQPQYWGFQGNQDWGGAEETWVQEKFRPLMCFKTWNVMSLFPLGYVGFCLLCLGWIFFFFFIFFPALSFSDCIEMRFCNFFRTSYKQREQSKENTQILFSNWRSYKMRLQLSSFSHTSVCGNPNTQHYSLLV